jgi:hypothetical protein
MWYFVFIDKRSFRIFIKYLIIWCITFNRVIYCNYINKTGCPLSIINNWNQIKISRECLRGYIKMMTRIHVASDDCVIFLIFLCSFQIQSKYIHFYLIHKCGILRVNVKGRSFFFLSLCCLSFFDLQILITPLVSSISSFISSSAIYIYIYIYIIRRSLI